MTHASDHPPLRLLDRAPPEAGEAVELAPGLLWMRLPLPMHLNHINLYALDEGDSWTLIDAGLNAKPTRDALEALLAGPLGAKPVSRLILTHHHPDHVGLAAFLMERGAQLWTSRTAWLTARMLTLDHHERPTEARMRFLRRAGWSAERLEQTAREEPFNFSRVVGLPPEGYRRLREGDVIEAGGRAWRVRCGEGHAPEQLTLWSSDGALALTADQILPGISPNIGVHPSEPDANPLAGWLESCARLRDIAPQNALALPGHQRPFTGVAARLTQLLDEHESALRRIEAQLAKAPATAVDCFETLFGRRIGNGEYGLATAEAVAHVNYLRDAGRAVAREDADGALRFAPAQ